jgi:hypothetical protein
MNFEFKKNSSGKLRGAMCDNETHIGFEVFKNVSYLRLTYQLKLLAYRAAKEDKYLIVSVPDVCVISESFLSLKKSLIDNTQYKQERIRLLRKK